MGTEVIYMEIIKIHIAFLCLDEYLWNVGNYGKTILML